MSAPIGSTSTRERSRIGPVMSSSTAPPPGSPPDPIGPSTTRIGSRSSGSRRASRRSAPRSSGSSRRAARTTRTRTGCARPAGTRRLADAVNYAAGWCNTQRGFLRWMAEPDIAEWLSTCRLSAFGNAGPYLGDPATQGGLQPHGRRPGPGSRESAATARRGRFVRARLTRQERRRADVDPTVEVAASRHHTPTAMEFLSFIAGAATQIPGATTSLYPASISVSVRSS